MSVREWHDSLKPREKALSQGIGSLSDAELLALVIRSGSQGRDVVTLCRQLLRTAGSLGMLLDMPAEKLMEYEGIGPAKALELTACRELIKRASYQQLAEEDVINSPARLKDWLVNYIGHLEQEHFVLVYLDHRHHVKGYRQLFQGANNAVSINPADLFRSALKAGARSLIIAHNHPGGSPLPSLADDMTTRDLCEAGALMGIPIIDHVVVCRSGTFSYREHGLIRQFT